MSNKSFLRKAFQIWGQHRDNKKSFTLSIFPLSNSRFPCVLTQAEIGAVVGVSRKQVADYNQIINKIVPSFLELAKKHQLGRGTSSVPNGTFNFTEGWFRTSGRRIVDMYLRGWNTQEDIAEVLGVATQTVSNVVNDSKNGQMSKIGKDFKPLLYNIWKKQKGDVIKDMQKGQLSKMHNDFKPLIGEFPEVFFTRPTA